MIAFLQNLDGCFQNAELFALTYGALVVQLIQDYEDYEEVNKQLEKMGYNIGTRLIEDLLAKSNLGRCSDFKDVGEAVAKVCSVYFIFNTVFSELWIGWFQVVPQYYPDCHTLWTTTLLAKSCIDFAAHITNNIRLIFYINTR